MKSNVKTIILLILGTIFAFPILVNANFNYFGGFNSENLEVEIESNLKRAGYWEIGSIKIDDYDPDYNWSKTANDNDWCNGDGSWSNPYIIENVTITSISYLTGSGIYIENSKTKYFTIRNVKVSNAVGSGNAGIWVGSTNNGTFMNNNCSTDNHCGIYMRYGDNNTITGNTVINNGYGIELYDVDNSIVSGNTANYNGYGINIRSSNNNTISGNTANYNMDIGIYLVGHNNTLSGNTANYNNDGIQTYLSTNNAISGNTVFNNTNGMYIYESDTNAISGNTANNNTKGIHLMHSDTNTISGNTANYNFNGIYLKFSDDNTISGNTLIGNDGCIGESSCSGNIFSDNVGCMDGQGGNGGGVIPGYNLFFLLGFLSVAVILISKRLKKS